MDLRLTPFTVEQALQLIKARGGQYDAVADFAIAVKDGDGYYRGVILLNANGEKCALAHLYTDGTALVGSILYGAAWRAAKALGYTEITL